MKSTLGYFCLIATMLLIGCTKENKETKIQGISSDYFPLKTGNVWNYNHSRTEVKGIVEFGSKAYFEVLNQYFAADTVYASSREYYRSTPNGEVFRIADNAKNEILLYNLLIPEHSSWEFNESNSSSTWKVTKTSDSKTITVKNRKIEDCIQFDYDIVEAVDDEHTIILAPGIGKLISYSVWGLGDTLKNAVVNGVKIVVQ